MPRLAAIGKHWEKVPPISVSIAAIATFLGMQRPTQKKQQQDPSQLAEFFGGAGFNAEKPEWLRKQKS